MTGIHEFLIKLTVTSFAGYGEADEGDVASLRPCTWPQTSTES